MTDTFKAELFNVLANTSMALGAIFALSFITVCVNCFRGQKRGRM